MAVGLGTVETLLAIIFWVEIGIKLVEEGLANELACADGVYARDVVDAD